LNTSRERIRLNLRGVYFLFAFEWLGKKDLITSLSKKRKKGKKEKNVKEMKEKGKKGKKTGEKEEIGKKGRKRWFLLTQENKQNLIGKKNHIFPQGERIPYIHHFIIPVSSKPDGKQWYSWWEKALGSGV